MSILKIKNNLFSDCTNHHSDKYVLRKIINISLLSCSILDFLETDLTASTEYSNMKSECWCLLLTDISA